MTKKKLPPYQPNVTDPESDAINRLEVVGVRADQGRDGGKWYVKRARDGAVLPGSSPLGYPSRAEALRHAIELCTALIACQRATNLAYTEYVPVAQGRYTYADPSVFAARYRAAREYERLEASKLGLPIRADRITENAPRRRG